MQVLSPMWAFCLYKTWSNPQVESLKELEDREAMKTPDEIKQALECCFYDSAQCADCPYYPTSCDRELVMDAREYIKQLETVTKSTEQIRWERDIAIGQLKELGISLGEKVDGKNPRWISVNERLPEAKLAVLVLANDIMYDNGVIKPCPSVHVGYTRGEYEGFPL